MKANELRIGNWVMGDSERPYQIELSDFSDWYDDHNSHEYGDHVHPIPITEEWLDMFGFKDDQIMRFRDLLMLAKGDEEYCAWINTLTHGRVSSVKYIHQLQNLYYALTGEELIINQNK